MVRTAITLVLLGVLGCGGEAVNQPDVGVSEEELVGRASPSDEAIEHKRCAHPVPGHPTCDLTRPWNFFATGAARSQVDALNRVCPIPLRARNVAGACGVSAPSGAGCECAPVGGGKWTCIAYGYAYCI